MAQQQMSNDQIECQPADATRNGNTKEKEEIQPPRPNQPKEEPNDPSPPQKPPFEPKEGADICLSISPPDELWLASLQCCCTFPPELFDKVMFNLVKNPNITSSHLFRADILYDSEKDVDQKLLKQIRKECLPRPATWPNSQLERTIVRKLIPRNPQLDEPLTQTCHFLRQQDENQERNLVMYIPHVDQPEDMPFYHPSVSQLAFLHTWTSQPSIGSLTLLYRPFPAQELGPKLQRTALRLLSTIHKHGQGQLLGYQKRVHHDQIIPQQRYQDTYTWLKSKYGRKLSEQWVEVTDPGKHVFEDIGIAAFLIELWNDMYGRGDNHPGFVDIGCGNGVLVYILLEEGYKGFGFDARRRKTWEIFPKAVQERLEQRLLVPSILQSEKLEDERWHDGLFEPGTFIVSNHADELTAWTPLLAHLNHSAFIAIPCCSHDLSGARFRAPATTRSLKEVPNRLPQQTNGSTDEAKPTFEPELAAETGSLKRTKAQKKMPSAYSTLCSYVASMAVEVGFQPEEDVLRIPSTRNSCIIGRKRTREPEEASDRPARVVQIVERELRKDIESISTEWIERAEKLTKKPSSGH